MEQRLKDLVNQLKEIDIDGETAEDILEELGLREQVLYQILDSEKYVSAKMVFDDIVKDKEILNKQFDNYYFDKIGML